MNGTGTPLRALTIRVRFQSGRYHGAPEWPPSPGRLFQALVAGAGPLLSKDAERALRWLERVEPPLIKAPSHWNGQEVRLFVPNNDLDAVGGDPGRVAEIRTSKRVRPVLFDEMVPLVYIWTFPQMGGDEAHASIICALAERLYQLGRGVDMAFAHADVGPAEATETILVRQPGVIYRPAAGPARRLGLTCPVPGSLKSLQVRYAAGAVRFDVESKGRGAVQIFTQAPKPLFRRVSYDHRPARALFDLRPEGDIRARSTWPLVKTVQLVEGIRDAAADRLCHALPDRAGSVTGALIGRRPGEPGIPPDRRVRLTPVPSIGYLHADRGIRRLLVEVPAICPLKAEDVFWAFSGLELPVVDDGPTIVLVRTDDWTMLDHYGIALRARQWRTVTPAALPESARRRRIEPDRRREEAKGGRERAEEEHRASFAITQALRHAGITIPAENIRVQREPFEGRGERAEAFAPRTRFPKERLWHVQLTFSTPVAGPLIIGDGRFLGLGLLAPRRHEEGVFAFAIEDGLAKRPEPTAIASAMRRAVMARVQEVLGPHVPLPAYFSGHLPNGAPAVEDTPHLSFGYDPLGSRILVVAPHHRDRTRASAAHRRYLAVLEVALADLGALRAGAAGRLAIRMVPLDLAEDPLFAAATHWTSITPYLVNRHTTGVGAEEALRVDLLASCRKLNLPRPEITVEEVRGIAGLGLTGRAALTFPVAVPGPLLLGRNRHSGGGLFLGSSFPRAIQRR